MKKPNGCYNLFFKTAGFLLAMLFLLLLAVSAVGLIGIVELGAYTTPKDTLLQDCMENLATSLADDLASYRAQSTIEPLLLSWNVGQRDVRRYYEEAERTNFRFTITNEQDSQIYSTYNGEPVFCQTEVTVQPYFYKDVVQEVQSFNGFSMEPVLWHDYEYTELPANWTVRCYVLEDMAQLDNFGISYRVIDLAYTMRWWVIVLLAAGLLGSIAMLVYLLSAAGRRAGREGIAPNPLDKLPADLYFAVLGGLCLAGVVLFARLLNYLDGHYWEENGYILALVGLGGLSAAIAALLLGGLSSLSTRLKLGGGYIWRRTVCFWVLHLLWRFIKWCFSAAATVLRWTGKVFRLLPLIWQWLLLGGGLIFLLLLGFAERSGMLLIISVLLWLTLTVYLAVSIGRLQKSVHAMASGRLDSRVPTEHLHGNFRQMAQDMNAISAGAELDVERRMRSERMKTELITNVSHDIKTPLTSIVSYVDLLQKAETEQQRQTYLEVLARQAQRLKKLTEDLVEMSKASSGNLTANVEKTSIVELVNQALGEYEEKMERAMLTVVKNLPEVEIFAQADGRLFWRVMDNVLGNCVKYAMPGTRVYTDVTAEGGSVSVSVKNVSKEPLNITAEELMERFVRGDRSRNTEGSGLGLNIAKSLMELQGGQLRLQVDGDLFKATLTLPGCASATNQE